MSATSASASGQLDEIGWNEADGGGRVSRAAAPVLLVAILGAYWSLLWVQSGLAPLAYLASHAPRGGAKDDRSDQPMTWRKRTK